MGCFGVTTKTREYDDVVHYLNGSGKHHLGEEAAWSSISIARDVATEVHHDYHNYKGTRNFTTSVGQSGGGGLWLEDRSVTEATAQSEVKWRRTTTGQWLPGRIHDTHNKFLEFDPFLKHATEPWTGTRWSITYHTTRHLDKAGHELRKFLKGCPFPLPRKEALAAGETRTARKPRASTRRNIFNNPAKIGVMMATLITAAGSYMTDHFFPEVDVDFVVMFEIGDTEATREAAAMSKDVFEPMTWERYRSPEGKDGAHIVNGGGTRELRINLDGKPSQSNEALVHLVKYQLEDGRTVVINGGANDELIGIVITTRTVGGRVFVVLFKEKPETKPVFCQDRVHEVRVVSREGASPLPMGAGGITFGEGTPGTVATALRRLHQSLGHPRPDRSAVPSQASWLRSFSASGREIYEQVCDATAGPKIARPSTLPPTADFNHTLGLDLFFCHDTNDEKHGFLSVGRGHRGQVQ